MPRCLLFGNAMLHGACHAHAHKAVVLGKLFAEVLVGGMHVLVDVIFRLDVFQLLRKVDGVGAIDNGPNEFFGLVGRNKRLPAARAFRFQHEIQARRHIAALRVHRFQNIVGLLNGAHAKALIDNLIAAFEHTSPQKLEI